LNSLYDVIGWLGSVLVVLAYGLNSYQKLKSDSVLFYLLNIIGGILLVIYSLHKDALPNVFINAVWIVIAIPALMRVITGKRF
jgi:hypothetical protein